MSRTLTFPSSHDATIRLRGHTYVKEMLKVDGEEAGKRTPSGLTAEFRTGLLSSDVQPADSEAVAER